MMMQLSHTYNNYHSGDDFHDNDDAHTYNATSDDNSVCMGRKTGTGKEMTLKNFLHFSFVLISLFWFWEDTFLNTFDEFDIYVLHWSGLESDS